MDYKCKDCGQVFAGKLEEPHECVMCGKYDSIVLKDGEMYIGYESMDFMTIRQSYVKAAIEGGLVEFHHNSFGDLNEVKLAKDAVKIADACLKHEAETRGEK